MAKDVRQFAAGLSDAYSTYGYKNGWSGCIRMLRARGYNDREIEAVIRSKWTRWARDCSGGNVCTSTDLKHFLDNMKNEITEVNKLTREHWGEQCI